MTNDVLETLLATYGPVTLVAGFLIWQWKGGIKDDPGARILEALADLRERVAKIEGYLEGDK